VKGCGGEVPCRRGPREWEHKKDRGMCLECFTVGGRAKKEQVVSLLKTKNWSLRRDEGGLALVRSLTWSTTKGTLGGGGLGGLGMSASQPMRLISVTGTVPAKANNQTSNRFWVYYVIGF